MNLHLVITNTGPPGGWYYKDPITGREHRPVAWNDMKPEVDQSRRANGHGPVTIEELESQVCKHVPPEWCGNVEVQGRVAPLTFDQVLQGTAILGDWMAHGANIVSQEEANTRTRICAHCHYNSGISGCSSCSMGKVRELVGRIVGQRTTQGDGMIQACKICGCSLKAKVWIPIEILQRHMTAEQNAAFPDWCWCKKNPPIPSPT